MTIPIHVINLPHRIDRKSKLIAEFEKQKITNYTFADAIHGETLNIEEMSNKGIVDFRIKKLKRGEYGCYLSHMNVWKSILESPEELHLILEDDVYFVLNFNSRLNRIIQKVKDVEWDIFYIGINYDESGSDLNGTYVGDKKDGIYFPNNLGYGTHAYLIKKQTILNHMDKFWPIRLQIDLFMMRNPELKKLCLVKRMVKTTFQSDSDTQEIV